MIGRNNIQSLRRLATVAYASLSLLLGWLGVIVGFGLLVLGILGAITGQIIWSFAWAVMTASKGSPADSKKAKPETEGHSSSTLSRSQPLG
jgi:hypothetical protein